MIPCAVVVNSCGSIPSDSIIKGILDVDTLPEPVAILPEIRGYPWHIDTKYYQTDVQICSLDKKSIGNQDFADAVNAVILPFDSLSKDGLSVAEQWLAFTDELDPEIKILICNNCVEDESENSSFCISKLQAQRWCVENGFELVELNPILSEEDSELEDDFPESTGISRVIQALHAHIWPNLVMKDQGNRLPPVGLQNALNGLTGTTGGNRVPETKVNGDSIHAAEVDYSSRKKLVAEIKPTPKIPVKPNIAIVSPSVISSSTSVLSTTPDHTDQTGAVAGAGVIGTVEGEGSSSTVATSSTSLPSPTKDERLATMLQAMDSMPEESFEELFQNLNTMKSKAESLSPSQRKAFAEQMAVAFWKSIGGNDSEIEGISSDEES